MGLPKWSVDQQYVSSMVISFWSVSQTANRDMFCLQENCPVRPHTSCLGSLVIPPKILVRKRKSPVCVKLNAPATGQRIGTGSFFSKRSYFHSISFLNCTQEQTVWKSFMIMATPLRNRMTL